MDQDDRTLPYNSCQPAWSDRTSDLMDWKDGLQELQYQFPYHHIPHFNAFGGVSCVRSVWWGVYYLCLLRHVQKLVDSLGPRSALDVGCGDGRLLGLLAPQLERAVGVDLSDRAIRFAQAFTPEVTFVASEVSAIEEHFDVVTAIEVLEHIPDDQCARFIHDLEQRMVPGGHMILTVPSVRLPLEKKHYRHYDEELLRTQIRAGSDRLEVVRFEHLIRYSLALRTALFLLNNSVWTLELAPLQRLLWEVTWRGLRQTRPGKGQHLLAICKKSG